MRPLPRATACDVAAYALVEPLLRFLDFAVPLLRLQPVVLFALRRANASRHSSAADAARE